MLDINISFNHIDENGTIKEFIIVDRFSNNNKNYIIYKEDGKEDLYADLYEIVDDKIKIIPIDNDADYDIVDKYLENL